MLSIWLVLTIFLNFDPAEARDCNCGKVPRLAEHFAYLNTVDVENRSPPGQNSLTCLTVPFMATMRAVGTNKTLCSGLILSQKMVIFPFNCLVVQAKEVPWGKYEIQVGSHSKSGGSFHQVRSLQTATNLAVGHSSYYLGFTLSNPIEFDCVNTLPICLNAPSANASEFVVVGHSLKDAAMRDYKDSGLYTVGTMKSFPCPPNHKHSLCLYSDKIGLMDADEGGPALVLENGIFYVVGMAAGGHIMEYENQFGRKGVVGYAHYEYLNYSYLN
uniref:Peptidase S1 domain-containing protein n=1 Tax=Panagrellus redivivus TaxID=6233 RepID=A0A7E4VNR4_PANRE